MTEKTENERPDVFLARLMCERKGKKENIPLGVAFWKRDEWKLFFKNQVLAANSLLKVYPFQVVYAAITHKKSNWMYSLRSPQLKQALIEEFAKYERRNAIEQKLEEKKLEKQKLGTEVIQTEVAPVILENKDSLRSRLD